MVGHDGAVKVVDFGIATASVSTVHTNPGVVRGKASYMSPEQCLGDPIDHRTDVFALGIVLYELTTGHRCFPGNNDFERMLAVVRNDYVPPRQLVGDFPEDLEAVIARALAIDPAERFPSAAAMIEALHRVATARGWQLDARTIELHMQDLFGVVAEPWMLDLEDVTTPSQQTVVSTTRSRRLARGTACESCLRGHEDDAPTRGRRSVPRMWARPACVPIPPDDPSASDREPLAA